MQGPHHMLGMPARAGSGVGNGRVMSLSRHHAGLGHQSQQWLRSQQQQTLTSTVHASRTV